MELTFAEVDPETVVGVDPSMVTLLVALEILLEEMTAEGSLAVGSEAVARVWTLLEVCNSLLLVEVLDEELTSEQILRRFVILSFSLERKLATTH